MAKTVVTNISGSTRYFGYLGKHGLTLANNVSVTLEGDLRTRLAGGAHRYSRSRELASLNNDEIGGKIHVVDHPTLETSS